MNIELAIALGIVVGLAVGLLVDRNARKERDRRIAELEQTMTTNRNVMESQNDTIQRLRRKLDKKNGTKEN